LNFCFYYYFFNLKERKREKKEREEREKRERREIFFLLSRSIPFTNRHTLSTSSIDNDKDKSSLKQVEVLQSKQNSTVFVHLLPLFLSSCLSSSH
jgi:hypothetical protein